MASCCVLNASDIFSTCLLRSTHTSKRFLSLLLNYSVMLVQKFASNLSVCQWMAFDVSHFLEFPSLLLHCCLGDRQGIQLVKTSASNPLGSELSGQGASLTTMWI